jgi:predicted dehydrogenase
VAAADPDAAARDRARRLTGVSVHDRAEALLARDDVDAVVVCAPTPLHADLAVAACEAGKHLYLEKPIATDLEDARRVLQAAESTGVKAVMGFNRRRHPAFERARELVLEGRLGRVLAVHAAFCERSPPDDLPPWKRDRSTGGGVLLDLASHHVDLARWILDDEVDAVQARIESAASDQDSAWVRLSMRRGTEVQGFFSFRGGLADSLELIGERGTLRVDRHGLGLLLRTPRRFGYGVRHERTAPHRDELASRLLRVPGTAGDPSYRRSLAAFVRMLGGGPHGLASLGDGLRSLEVVLAAESSASSAGSAVPVGR